MPSISGFQRLQNHMVGMYVFFGCKDDDEDGFASNKRLPDISNLLPESLETLYISGTAGETDILALALQKLLHVKHVHTPMLREIAFEVNADEDGELPDLAELETCAVAADVRLRPIDCRLFITQGPLSSDPGRGMDGSITWAGSMQHDGEMIWFRHMATST